MAVDLPAHGGDLTWAEARYGRPPGGRWLDFSASVHPDGCPPAVRTAAAAALERIERYPDPAARRATAALARRLGVPPECLLLTNGGSEALHLALAYLRPGTVGLLQPCFADYVRAARAAGAEVVQEVSAPPFAWRRLPPALRACDALLLGRPNNPTGLLPPAVEHPQVVWDEAFIDFVAGCPTLRREAAAGRCVVVGSLTKLYGLAGVRAGYVVAAPEAISAMSDLQPSWSVNAPAQAAVEAACAVDVDLAWLPPARTELAAGLLDCGLEPFPSDANFLLVRGAAPDLCERLGRQGILVRDARNVPGLGPGWIRVAVRRPADNARLIAAIRAAARGR